VPEEERDTNVVSFLADSDDEQERAEPANRPSAMPDDLIKAVQAELEACLSKLASNKSVDWLMWWSVSAATYPILSAVAPCFLSMVVIIVQ